MDDAIELNTQRMPRYADLTQGASLPFSRKLIFWEKTLVSFSWLVDRIGKKYQDKGIPYLVNEFLDMKLAPEFSENFPEGIDFKKPLEEIEIKSWKDKINGAIKKDELPTLNACLLEWHTTLSHQVHVYCMTRHLVESMWLIQSLIPGYDDICHDANMRSPKKHSYDLIRWHLRLLNYGKKFDENVAFIQNMGVPFIFQDVPEVHLL